MPRSNLLSFRAIPVLILLASCRPFVPEFGANLESAKRNADQFLTGFAYRFYEVSRDPQWSRTRAAMGRSALTPGGLYRDTSLWTERRDSTRAITIRGLFDGNRYRFATTPGAGLPTRLGEARHIMQLTHVADDIYSWRTTVEHAVGRADATQIAAGFSAVLATPARGAPAAIRADGRAAFPRAGAVMSQIVRVDSLITVKSSDTSAIVTLNLTLVPDRLPPASAAYRDYLKKYFSPADIRLTLSDRRGIPYFDIVGNRGVFVIRYHASPSGLLSMEDVPRARPDTLALAASFTGKFLIFRVGFTNLLGDFIVGRDAHESRWLMRFRREPSWVFPLAVDHLIKSSLRRPFIGRGSELLFAMRDAPNGETQSIRVAATTVQESAILRWLGGLGAAAVGDYEGPAELQMDRWLYQLFTALRGDVAAMDRR